MQVGTNPSATYHSQPSLATPAGQPARSSSASRPQANQYDNEQLANIRPRLCVLRKWPHYDGKKNMPLTVASIPIQLCRRFLPFSF